MKACSVISIAAFDKVGLLNAVGVILRLYEHDDLEDVRVFNVAGLGGLLVMFLLKGVAILKQNMDWRSGWKLLTRKENDNLVEHFLLPLMRFCEKNQEFESFKFASWRLRPWESCSSQLSKWFQEWMKETSDFANYIKQIKSSLHESDALPIFNFHLQSHNRDTGKSVDLCLCTDYEQKETITPDMLVIYSGYLLHPADVQDLIIGSILSQPIMITVDLVIPNQIALCAVELDAKAESKSKSNSGSGPQVQFMEANLAYCLYNDEDSASAKTTIELDRTSGEYGYQVATVTADMNWILDSDMRSFASMHIHYVDSTDGHGLVIDALSTTRWWNEQPGWLKAKHVKVMETMHRHSTMIYMIHPSKERRFNDSNESLSTAIDTYHSLFHLVCIPLHIQYHIINHGFLLCQVRLYTVKGTKRFFFDDCGDPFNSSLIDFPSDNTMIFPDL